MGRPVDSELPLEVVTTRVDKLMCDGPLAVSDLADYNGVLLATGCINHMLALQFSSHQNRLKNGVRRIISILVVIRVGQLLHAIEAPSVQVTGL